MPSVESFSFRFELSIHMSQMHFHDVIFSLLDLHAICI